MTDQEDSNYRGKRASEFTKTESSPYVGKRRRSKAKDSGLFHDPFSAYGDDEAEQIRNDGSRFDAERGRHEALLESVYSTELDGRDFSVPIVKKSSRALLGLMVGGIIVTITAVVAVVLISSSSEQEPQEVASVLGPVFADAYPNRAPTDAFERVEVVPNGFGAAEGSSLTTKRYASLPAGENCVVEGAGDFCLAGTMELESSSARVFYSGDVGSAAPFKESYEVSYLVEKPNQLIASTVVSFNGAPTRFLVFMDGLQGDGWFMEVPLEQAPEASKKLAQEFTHQL